MDQAQEISESLSGRIAANASVRQVFGEPIVSVEKTIVPAAANCQTVYRRSNRIAGRKPPAEARQVKRKRGQSSKSQTRSS